MLDPVKNKAVGTLAVGYNESATVITLIAGDTAKFPNPNTEGAFNIVWFNWTDYASYPWQDPNYEIVRVTGQSGNTFTIIRGQDSTAPQTHNITGKTYKLILSFTKRAADGIPSILSIKATGGVCDGVTNDNTAIQEAISAGAKIIYLPKNTFWIPTSNLIPGGIHYIGEDWTNVVIKASNPTTEYVTAGQGALLENVAIFDKTGVDIGLSPNVARPIRIIASNRITSTMPGCGGWPNEFLYLHIGEAGLDRPGFGIANYGTGDSIWTGLIDNGVGFRADINQNAPTKIGIGFYGILYGAGKGLFLESGAGATGILLRLDAKHNIKSLTLEDSGSTTIDSFAITATAKTSGVLFNLYHANSAMNASSCGILMNFGNAGGSFGGTFFEFRLAGVTKASLRYDGMIYTVLQYNVGANKVVGARVIDARLDDAINSGDATTDGVIDALRDLVLAHGLGAVA